MSSWTSDRFWGRPRCEVDAAADFGWPLEAEGSFFPMLLGEQEGRTRVVGVGVLK